MKIKNKRGQVMHFAEIVVTCIFFGFIFFLLIGYNEVTKKGIEKTVEVGEDSFEFTYLMNGYLMENKEVGEYNMTGYDFIVYSFKNNKKDEFEKDLKQFFNRFNKEVMVRKCSVLEIGNIQTPSQFSSDIDAGSLICYTNAELPPAKFFPSIGGPYYQINMYPSWTLLNVKALTTINLNYGEEKLNLVLI